MFIFTPSIIKGLIAYGQDKKIIIYHIILKKYGTIHINENYKNIIISQDGKYLSILLNDKFLVYLIDCSNNTHINLSLIDNISLKENYKNFIVSGIFYFDYLKKIWCGISGNTYQLIKNGIIIDNIKIIEEIKSIEYYENYVLFFLNGNIIYINSEGERGEINDIIIKNNAKTEFNKIDSEYKISQYIKDYKEKLFDKDCYQNNELKNLYIPIKSEIIQKVLESFPEDEEEENKTVGELLKSIGIIARKSQQFAQKIYDILNISFKYYKGNLNYFNNQEEHIQFSGWVKNSLNLKFYEDFCELKNKDKNENNEFFKKCLLKLTKFYTQCLLSYNKIEFKYTEENVEFNKNEMEDINEIRGNKKNVNFTVLPGLFCNGAYLDIGKIQVFTYTQNTFHFIDKCFL